MLDEFRSTYVTWDKATSRIYSPVTANASDENGRKLVVQIVNGGQVEDLTGATLHLYWETRDKAHDGLDAFDAVDLKKGEFELSYTTGMLSNQGVLNANLVLIDTVGRVVSERFKITVTEGIDNDAIQSENSFSSLTQALIDISDLEQNYAPRLNDLTAQLQQTVRLDDSNLTLNNFTESDRAIIQGLADGDINAVLGSGNVVTANVADKAITPSKTTFINTSNNLYNKNTSTEGFRFEPSTGEIVADGGRVISDWVSVDENAQYSISGISRIVYYNSSKMKIWTTSDHSSSTPSTITTPPDASFIRFHHNILAVNVQINKGANLLSYDEYYEYLDDKLISEIDGSKVKGMTDASFEKHSVRLNKLIEVDSSTNLINIRLLEYGKVIPVGSGTPIPWEQYAVTDFIRIDGNQPLSFKDVFRITQYDGNKSYISTIDGIGNSTATTNAQTRFIRVSLDNYVGDSKLPTAQLNLSSSLLPYEVGGDTIKVGALPHKGIGHDELTDLSLVDEKTSESILFNHTERKLVRTGGDYPLIDTVIPDTFTTNRTYPGMEGVISDYKSSDIYDLYDALMAQYPTYISRTLIANESSPSALPVYRYDFKPVAPSTSEYPKPIKILLTSGVHPEVMGVWYLYHFLENVCNNWQDDEYLEAFRFNVHLIVIPVNAPWSYDNRSRVNFNGVDIARNFPAGWQQGEIGYTWGGTEPLTEPEAIAVYDILEQNKDLIAAIDCHNFGGVEGDYHFLWGAAGNIFSRHVVMNHVQKMDRKWKKEYGFMSQDLDKFIGHTTGYSPGGSLGRQADAFGIKGALTYETGARLRSDVNISYTSNVMTLSYEAFTNFMGMFLRELINTW